MSGTDTSKAAFMVSTLDTWVPSAYETAGPESGQYRRDDGGPDQAVVDLEAMDAGCRNGTRSASIPQRSNREPQIQSSNIKANTQTRSSKIMFKFPSISRLFGAHCEVPPT